MEILSGSNMVYKRKSTILIKTFQNFCTKLVKMDQKFWISVINFNHSDKMALSTSQKFYFILVKDESPTFKNSFGSILDHFSRILPFDNG